MLLCYYVNMLLCYYDTLLQCYYDTMLLWYYVRHYVEVDLNQNMFYGGSVSSLWLSSQLVGESD